MSTAMQNAHEFRSGHFSPASLLGGSPQTTDISPLFQETLEKIAESCIDAFETIAGEGISLKCSLGGIAVETAGDVLVSLDRTAITGLFEVPSAGSRLVVSLDHDFVEMVIELMCGGMCTEPLPQTPRPGTSIDRQFARVAFNLIASVFEKECLGFGLQSITFGQIETKLDPLVLGKRTVKVSVATFTLECRNRRADVRIAFPPAFLDRFKQDTLPAGPSEVSVDPAWTEHFQLEIGKTVVKLDAFLDANSLRLGDVASLKMGQILTLPKFSSSRCELRNDKKLLFRCELGQTNGRYSVRVLEAAPEAATDGESPHDLSPSYDLP